MYWNHRVVDLTSENGGEYLIAIREVCYEENGMPTTNGSPFVFVMSETMEGLREVIDRMKEALDQPILTPEDFKGK